MGFFSKISKKKQEDVFKQLESETMDLDQLKTMVISLIWHDDMPGLHDLCESQFIMAPLMIEKAIAEIVPGNHWNDVLFLMARKMIETNPDMFFLYTAELQKKRHLVKHPDGGKELMAPFVKFS